MLRSLFAHFEAREAGKAPPPEAFGSAAARRELRWVTAGRVALGIALVGVTLLLFAGPDLPSGATTAVLVASAVSVAVVVARGAVSLSRLAALERAEPGAGDEAAS